MAVAEVGLVAKANDVLCADSLPSKGSKATAPGVRHIMRKEGLEFAGHEFLDASERVQINIMTSDYGGHKLDRALRSGELSAIFKRIFSYKIVKPPDFTALRDAAARQIQAVYRSSLESKFLQRIVAIEKEQSGGRDEVAAEQFASISQMGDMLLEGARHFLLEEEASIRQDRRNWEIEERNLLISKVGRSFNALETTHRAQLMEEWEGDARLNLWGESHKRWEVEGCHLQGRIHLKELYRLCSAQQMTREKIQREHKTSEVSLQKFRSKRF